MLGVLTRLRLKARAIRGAYHNRREEMRRRPWWHDSAIRQAITDQFHRMYYDGYGQGGTWAATYWRGVPTEKCPLDLWIYQEIVYELRPDAIVETGTRFGGSALFLADMCELVGCGRVVTVDIAHEAGRPEHPRISYVRGSSVAAATFAAVKQQLLPADKVMVLLDSDHSKGHVLAELRLYSPLVSPGHYLIVEDTNIGGHPVAEDFGPGPMEAVNEFLAPGDTGFVPDRTREKFYLTFSPCGFLRRQ
jgi:cephalosporin hydroxylase